MKKISVVFLAVFMIAAIASAQHGGGPMGEHGLGDERGGPGGDAIVGSDGNIYLSSVIVDTTANTATQTIKAVSPAGTVVWTATLSAAGHPTLSDGNLIVEHASRASDGTVTTTLTAIATASGDGGRTAALFSVTPMSIPALRQPSIKDSTYSSSHHFPMSSRTVAAKSGRTSSR